MRCSRPAPLNSDASLPACVTLSIALSRQTLGMETLDLKLAETSLNERKSNLDWHRASRDAAQAVAHTVAQYAPNYPPPQISITQHGAPSAQQVHTFQPPPTLQYSPQRHLSVQPASPQQQTHMQSPQMAMPTPQLISVAPLAQPQLTIQQAVLQNSPEQHIAVQYAQMPPQNRIYPPVQQVIQQVMTPISAGGAGLNNHCCAVIWPGEALYEIRATMQAAVDSEYLREAEHRYEVALARQKVVLDEDKS